MSKRHSICLACALLLTSCADMNFPNAVLGKQAPIESALQEEALLLDERHRDTFLRLQKMARVSPGDKKAWAGVARIYFKNEDYGKAIVYAYEVLKRDPFHLEAKSIVAVSGLRASSVAIDGLRRDHLKNFSGVTDERALTDLLRSTLGEDVLVPNKRVNKTP